MLTLGAASAAALVIVPAHATTTGALPGGTSISVDVASPADGTHVAPGAQVTLNGSASIGTASNTANTTLVTGIDVSGSTSTSAGTTLCGNPDADGTSNDVLDCEVRSALNLNGAAAASGSHIADVGAVIFGTSGQTGDVGPAAGDQRLTGPTTDANANSKRDIEEVFGSVNRSSVGLFTNKNAGGNTNFGSAINAANTILSTSTQPNKIFVLMSDGVDTSGSSTQSAINARPAGTVIDTFAVGSGSSCGSATDPQQKSLAYIAAHAGGTCTAVTNPGSLPSILPGIITPHLTALSLTDNGGPATSITNTTPALPIAGPGSVNYSVTTGALAPGTHTLCVTATGTDPGSGTVTECKSVVVDKYQVIVTAQDDTKVFGQPNPPFTFTVTGLQGTDSLTTQPTCTSTATTNSDAGAYPITCSGAAVADPTKYDINYVDGTLTITQAASVVSGPNVHKMFGDPDPSFAPTASNGAPVPSGASCTAPTPHDNVGTYTLTCTGPAAQGNYTYSYVNGTLTVDAAASVVTGPTVHKTFGDPDPSFAPTASNGAPVPSGASCTAPTNHTNVGTYTLTCTGPAAQGNFTYTYVNGSLIVDPAASVVTGPNVHKVFGAADPSFAPTASNGAPVPSGAACTAPTPHDNVGTYVLTCTGPAAQGNYTYTYVNGSLTVDPAASVVTGPTVHKTFGDPDPSFAPTASGGAPVPTGATCTAPTPHDNVGTYTLTCTGPSAQGNYTYTYVNGSLTVDPAASVVSGPVLHKTYGDPDPSFAPTASGGAPVPSGAACTAPTPHDNVGTYTLTCTGPAAQGNYTYTYVNGSLTVDPAASVVSGPNVHKTYGDPDPSFAPTASNGAPVPSGAACTAPTPHDNVGTYTLTCAGPAAQGNYTYTYVNGHLTVDPAQVTATAQDVTKVYGQPDPPFTPQVSGLVNGDSLPATVTCSAASPHTNVGTYDITCTGPAASGNYTFTYVGPATLTVEKATPTVSTTPSGTTKLGGLASDTATLTGTGVATGIVVFRLYGPGDTTCSTPVATRTGPLTGNVAHSGNVQVVSGGGTYRWVATYAGDSNNNSSVSGCNEELFSVLGQTLTGRAYGLSVASSLGSKPLVNIAPLPDTGFISTTNSTAAEPPCLANIALLVGVEADCAAVATFNGFPSRSVGVASLAAAQIPITTLPLITVGAVQAESQTTCAGSSGSTTIAYLAVGSVVVISKPTAIKPNTTMYVGVVKLVLNQQKAFSTPDKGLTVNAIHITVNALGVAKANVVISSAESDISGCP